MGMVTQEAYFRQRVLNHAAKHGVTAAAIRYHMSRKTVHKWKKRYDGTVESLQDLPRTSHHFPRQQTAAELKLVKRYANLWGFAWYMYSCWEYSVRITCSIACFLTGSTSSRPSGNFSSMESMMPGGIQNQGPLVFLSRSCRLCFLPERCLRCCRNHRPCDLPLFFSLPPACQ